MMKAVRVVRRWCAPQHVLQGVGRVAWRRPRSLGIAPVLIGLALLGAPPLGAQERARELTVSGTVTDVGGGALVGATVEAVVAGQSIAVTATGGNGRYELQVPAGVPFAIRVYLDGFASAIEEVPGVSGDATRDVTLHIGRLSDTLVVTASGTEESRAAVTASTSVVTSADIEAFGSASLADVMKTVPGIAVESTGREGAQSSLFSRGGESDYNLVLVDGVRVNLNGGAFDFSRIAASEIERVEVVRGAQSSLWGSDAIGAVVQIFTKRAGAGDAPQITGSTEGGSFATWRGDARLTGGARQRIDYHAGVSYGRTSGAFADILPEDDRFDHTTIDAGFGAALGTRASVRSAVRYSNAQGRAVGNIAYGSRDRGTEYDTKDLSWHLDAAHTAGTRYTGTATVMYFRNDGLSADTIADPSFDVYALLSGEPGALFPHTPRLVRLLDFTEFTALSQSPGSLPAGQFLAFTPFGVGDFPFTSETRYRRPAVRYQGDFTWADGQRLSAGYEWERESDALVDAFSLDNNAFFVQQQFSLYGRWYATVGARVDSKESYDTFVSPKLSAGGFLVPARRGALSSVKVFGNIGKGIKAPTFSERLGGPFSDPNPDLAVERARTADLGVELTVADQRVRASAVYFHNDYRDQIAYRSGLVGDGVPEFLNIDGARARGMELEVGLQRPIGGFTASGSYSLVDTEVVTSINTSPEFQPGQPLLRRPRHSGTLRASYTAGRATVNANVRFIGQRHDNSFLFLETVPGAGMPAPVTTDITVNPGYVVGTLGLDVRASDAVTVYVRGDNIGNTSYESALGYPGLPRAATAGLRFRLGR